MRRAAFAVLAVVICVGLAAPASARQLINYDGFTSAAPGGTPSRSSC